MPSYRRNRQVQESSLPTNSASVAQQTSVQWVKNPCFGDLLLGRPTPRRGRTESHSPVPVPVLDKLEGDFLVLGSGAKNSSPPEKCSRNRARIRWLVGDSMVSKSRQGLKSAVFLRLRASNARRRELHDNQRYFTREGGEGIDHLILHVGMLYQVELCRHKRGPHCGA